MSRRNRRNIAVSSEQPWSNWCRLCANECVSKAGGDALKNKKGERELLTMWFQGLFSAQLQHVDLEQAKICNDCWKQMENLKHFVEHMEHVQQMYRQLDKYKDLSSKSQNWQGIVEAHLNGSSKQIKIEPMEVPEKTAPIRKELLLPTKQEEEAEEKEMMEEYHLEPEGIEEEYLQDEYEDLHSEYVVTVEEQSFETEQVHEAVVEAIDEDDTIVCYMTDAEMLENGNENYANANFQEAVAEPTLQQQQQNLLPVQLQPASKRIKQVKEPAAEAPEDLTQTELAQCAKCERTFTSKRALKRHIVVHSNTKFGCMECNNEFTCVTSLNVHVRRVHGKSKRPPNEEFISDGEYAPQVKKKRRNWTHDINDVAKNAIVYRFLK